MTNRQIARRLGSALGVAGLLLVALAPAIVLAASPDPSAAVTTPHVGLGPLTKLYTALVPYLDTAIVLLGIAAIVGRMFSAVGSHVPGNRKPTDTGEITSPPVSVTDLGRYILGVLVAVLTTILVLSFGLPAINWILDTINQASVAAG